MLIVLTIATASAAQPSRGEGRLSAAQPPLLAGNVRALASAATAEIPTTSVIRLYAVEADVEIHRVRMSVLEAPFGDVATNPTYANETFSMRDVSIHFRPGVDGRAYVHAWNGLDVIIATTGWRAAADPTPESYEYKMNTSLPFFFSDAPPAGAAAIPDGEATLGRSTQASLFFAEGELEIRGRDGTRHERLGTQSERGASGPLAAAPYRTDAYVFVTINASELDGGFPLKNARVAVDAMQFEGSVTFEGATGSINVGNRHYPLVDARVQIVGVATILPPDSARPEGWAVSGDFTSLRFWDGRDVIDTTVRDVGIAAFLTLTLLAATGLGRELLGAILASFYTRIKPSRALESPERAQLYAYVTAQPGEHLRDLQRAMKWGWGTLHYHLAVLRKSDLIVIERAGKHVLAYPRTRSGEAAEHRLSLRGQAANIYAALSDSSTTRSELARRLGLSRQLVAHHLSLLEREGLVVVEDGRPKGYRRRREEATFVAPQPMASQRSR